MRPDYGAEARLALETEILQLLRRLFQSSSDSQCSLLAIAFTSPLRAFSFDFSAINSLSEWSVDRHSANVPCSTPAQLFVGLAHLLLLSCSSHAYATGHCMMHLYLEMLHHKRTTPNWIMWLRNQSWQSRMPHLRAHGAVNRSVLLLDHTILVTLVRID